MSGTLYTGTVAGTGTGTAIALSPYYTVAPQVGVVVGTGTGQYHVQFALEDYISNPANPTWQSVSTLSGTAGTASQVVTLDRRVSALRLVVDTAFPSGTGTILVGDGTAVTPAPQDPTSLQSTAWLLTLPQAPQAVPGWWNNSGVPNYS